MTNQSAHGSPNPHEADVVEGWRALLPYVRHGVNCPQRGLPAEFTNSAYRCLCGLREALARAEPDLPAVGKCDALWTNGLGQEGWCAFTAGHSGPHSFEARSASPPSQSVEEARERVIAGGRSYGIAVAYLGEQDCCSEAALDFFNDALAAFERAVGAAP